LKNWPQKLLIIGPNPFISQSSSEHSPSPELIFHIMKSPVLLSVLNRSPLFLLRQKLFKSIVCSIVSTQQSTRVGRQMDPTKNGKIVIIKRRTVCAPTYKKRPSTATERAHGGERWATILETV
jgi:hypothetical protein